MTNKGLVVLVTEGTGRFPDLTVALAGEGYDLELCAPFEAVRFAWQRPIDLALLDLSSAEADWPQLCQALRDCPNPVKILALTGSDTPSLDDLPAGTRPEAKVPAEEPAQVVLEVVARILGHAVDAEPLADFAVLMAHLWREGATGLLTIQGEVRTAVYFRNGTPVFAELGALSDTLGRILVRQEKLSEADFSRAIQVMTDSLIDNEQIRLGEVLIQMGLLTGDEIFEALRLQTREKLLRCFLWRRLRSDFESGEHLLASVEPFPCEVPGLLVEGTRRHFDQQRVDAVLEPLLDHRPLLVDPPAVVSKAYRVEASALRLLQSLTGEATLRQVWDSSEMERLVAGQLLAALVIAEVVTVDTSAPEAAQVSPDTAAETPAREEAPRAIARIRPVKKRKPKTEPLPASAPAVAARKPTSKLDRLNAEAAFQQGKRCQAQNSLAQALELFERAAALQPDAVEYAMHTAFVELLMAQDDTARRTAAGAAARLARAVLARNESSAEAYAVLGHTRLAEGETNKAVSMFKRAIQLDPNDIASARQVRLLHMRGKA